MATKRPSVAASRSSPLIHQLVHEHSRVNPRKMSTSVVMVVQQFQSQHAIDSESKYLSIWNLFVLLCIMHNIFFVTFILSFQLHDHVEATQIRVDVLEVAFLVDIVVNMHTTFYDEGNIVTELWRTRRKYLLSPMFVLDLIPLLPLRYVMADTNSVSAKLIDLTKLLRIWRIPGCVWHAERLLAKYFALVKLLKIVSACVVIAHTHACIRGLFYPLTAHRRLNSGGGHEGDPWLPNAKHTNMSVGLRYIASAFWSFGLLSGLFEGEIPRAPIAIAFNLCVMVSGVMMFAYICGTFFMISKCHVQSNEEFEAKLNQLKHILAYHRVPDDVRERALEYLTHEHEAGDTRDRQFLQLLAPSVSRDIRIAMYEKLLSHVPLFRPCDPHFIHALIGMMETVSVPASYILCREGDAASDLYFVQTGVLAMTKHASWDVVELRKDGYVGELGLFVDEIKCMYTVTAATYCILHKLSRKNAKIVLAAYPQWEPKIRESADRINERRKTQHPDPSLLANVVVKRLWWSKLLRHETIDRNGRLRFAWLVCIQVVLFYHIISTPLYLCFPVIQFTTMTAVVNFLCDALLWLDMYANLHLSFVEETEVILDTTKCARHYLRTNFARHLVSTFPWWIVAPDYHRALRLSRLLRLLDVVSNINDLALFVNLDGPKRTTLLCALLFTTYHLTGCFYFGWTWFEGYSFLPGQDWLPSIDLKLEKINDTHVLDGDNRVLSIDDDDVWYTLWNQYAHSLYYGASVITSLGRGIEPDSWNQYIFHLGFMMFGFIFMARIIDEVQKGITASAVEQVNFYNQRAKILWFLKQQRVPPSIHRRVSSYLEFWWCAHRGADVNGLLIALPVTTKQDILLYMCKSIFDHWTRLPAFEMSLMKPLATAFVNAVQIRLYGQGETIICTGDIADGIYFLLEGRVLVQSTNPHGIAIGMAFGITAGTGRSFSPLVADYHEHSTITESGCIVAYLPRDGIQAMVKIRFGFFDAFAELAALSKVASRLRKSLRWSRRALVISPHSDAIDPDSTVIVAWEVLIFVLISYQCLGVPFRMAFGRTNELASSEELIMSIELVFLIDLVLRFFLGYYEHGNKIMDRRSIRKRYVRSLTFYLDAIALLPFEIINWTVEPADKTDAWNINKLCRTIKLSTMLSRFEQSFILLHIHVRLFKLFFYTFFLSHWLGCLWFNFASHNTDILSPETGNFGVDTWMPPASLLNTSSFFKYYAALFWGFGTMSGCSPRAMPRTTLESFYNVFVMVCGVFLFTYVLGNLSDIIKVVDGNNRAFFSKLSTLRRFLRYYKFPADIDSKIKHYFLYSTFHSIHQEHLLDACLPPSLLTDTRMFLLQPMLEQVNFLHAGDLTHAKLAIRTLVSLLVQEIVPRDKVLCHQGDVGLEMYFVYAGCLDVYVSEEIKAPPPNRKPPNLKAASKSTLTSMKQLFNKQSSKTGVMRASSTRFSGAGILATDTGTIQVKVNEILAGGFFGEASLFSDKPRNASVQARTFCTVYKLSRDHLHAVFHLHPTWKAHVLRIVGGYQNELKNMLNTKLKKDLSIKMPTARRQSSTIMLVTRVSTALGSVCGLDTILAIASNTLRLVYRRVHRIKVQSTLYRWWMGILATCICYQALYVPYMLSFHVIIKQPWIQQTILALNILCDLVYLGDVWFRSHLVESGITIEFYEGDLHYPIHSRIVDVLCVLPIDYIMALASTYNNNLFRLNRCLKLPRCSHAISEITRFSVSNDVNYLRRLVGSYGFIVYWVGCAYFAMTYVDGFGEDWESWLPVHDFHVSENDTISHDIHRLLRALYYSTGIFTNTGVTLLPTTVSQYLFVIVVCLICLFMTSFFIGEVAGMFVCLTQHEVDFRIHEMHAQTYLGRTRLEPLLKMRIHNYLNYWWHAYHGVRHEDIFEELPDEIKGDAIVHVGHDSLTNFVNTFFRPLRPSSAELDKLRHQIARRVHWEAYPMGEFVILEGNIATTMYFVVRGSLLTTSADSKGQVHRYRQGDFFGEMNLLMSPSSVSAIRTLRACELMSLSAKSLANAIDAVARFKTAHDMVQEMYKNKENIAKQDIGSALRAMNPTFLDRDGSAIVTERDFWEAFRWFLHLYHVSHDKDIDMEVRTKYKFLDCSCCHGALATLYCRGCRCNFCTGCNLVAHLNTDREDHLTTTQPISVARRLFALGCMAKRWRIRARNAAKRNTKQPPKMRTGPSVLELVGAKGPAPSTSEGKTSSSRTATVAPL